jgi:hypothetical protein
MVIDRARRPSGREGGCDRCDRDAGPLQGLDGDACEVRVDADGRD